MRHLTLTLDSLAGNLALDEALLDAAEAGELSDEVLRLWEMPSDCVVLGRSSDPQVEVNLSGCRDAGVPVLRRPSGGGTILAGPGCLMYSVILSVEQRPQLVAIDQAHEFVLQQMSGILHSLAHEIQSLGTSDLALRHSGSEPWLKFSGNAMRMRRSHLLYHGTLLYDFDLAKIAHLLATPTRTPDYREDREHQQFVTNLNVERSSLEEILISGWQAAEALDDWPKLRTDQIVQAKYNDNPQWVILEPAS